jgi:hypothetical protein
MDLSRIMLIDTVLTSIIRTLDEGVDQASRAAA